MFPPMDDRHNRIVQAEEQDDDHKNAADGNHRFKEIRGDLQGSLTVVFLNPQDSSMPSMQK